MDNQIGKLKYDLAQSKKECKSWKEKFRIEKLYADKGLILIENLNKTIDQKNVMINFLKNHLQKSYIVVKDLEHTQPDDNAPQIEKDFFAMTGRRLK